MILVLMLACDPAAVTSDAGGPTDDQWDGNTGPYITQGEDTEPPILDTEALGASLTDALGQVLAINALGVIDAYEAVIEGMDDDCPSWYSSDGLPYWYDSCTTGEGSSFEGYAYLVPYDDYRAEDGSKYTGHQLYGIASIAAADGRTFSASGGAGIFTVDAVDGARASYSYLDHGFYDSASKGTWLAGPMDPSLTTYASWYDEADAGTIFLDGTITGLDGDLEVLVLDQVTLTQQAAGGCQLEPSATVSVMDGEGTWVDVVFSADGGAKDPLCDGCGTAYVQGQVAGVVCTDFSSLVDWSGSPWW